MTFSLALGGGGAKGLAHIEFLKAIDELGLKPREIAGTSMGSLIGAFYASGLTANEIEAIARTMNKRKIMSLTDFTFNNKGLIKGKKIMDWIREQLGDVEFKDLEIPLKVAVTNLSSGKVEIIDKGRVVDAIRRSISIPGIFEPISKNDSIYVDGGVLDQVPYDCLKGNVVAIDVTSKARVPDSINAYENLMYSFYVMRRHLGHKKAPSRLFELSLPKVGLLDFHKYDEVKKAVRKDVDDFRKYLSK
jgi:NTE family protein